MKIRDIYILPALLALALLLSGCGNKGAALVSPTSEANQPQGVSASPKPSATAEPTPTVPVEPSKAPAATLAPDPYNIAWWIQESSSDPVLNAEQIKALNEKNLTIAKTGMYDMSKTTGWTKQKVYDAVTAYSFPNKAFLDGREVTDSAKKTILSARNTEALKKGGDYQLRFAVITSNASLRSFPTTSRISDASGRHDYFQETGLNIGEPVLVLHDSADGEWSFVQSLTYAGWVKKADFGLCTKDRYEDYVQRRYQQTASAVVACKNAEVTLKNIVNPGAPAAEAISFKTYIRQGSSFFTADGSGNIFEFPMRNTDGSLLLESLEEVKQDSSAEAVFIKREESISIDKLLKYAGNLLGTPYSWGDEKEKGSDCSSTLQAVYAMFGLWLPRNTSSQIAMPVSVKDISALDSNAKTKYISERSAGTILYMPGHVMLVLGEYEGRIYILHNTTVSARDDGTNTEYYSCVITTADIGKTGKTLLDRSTMLVNPFELK